MPLNRRQFVILTVTAAAGCGESGETSPPAAQPAPAPATGSPAKESNQGVVDVGPLTDFPADGVYDSFRSDGLFVVRRNGQLFALSSICTHKGCKVRAKEDQSFYCKCHGSTFDPDGRVTKSPAKRDLPRLAVRTDEKAHILVDLNQPINSEPVQGPSTLTGDGA